MYDLLIGSLVQNGGSPAPRLDEKQKQQIRNMSALPMGKSLQLPPHILKNIILSQNNLEQSEKNARNINASYSLLRKQCNRG